MAERIATILIFFCIIGCREKQVSRKTGIFDFQDFFNKEAAFLDAGKSGLTKTVINKESVFSNTTKTPDWQKELSAFLSFSMIRPEHEGLYTVDTIDAGRGFTSLIYSSDNPKTRLQMAEVMFNPEHTVEKVTLIVKTHTEISNSDITMSYLPRKGYDIKGEIDSKIAGHNLIDVHVTCD